MGQSSQSSTFPPALARRRGNGKWVSPWAREGRPFPAFASHSRAECQGLALAERCCYSVQAQGWAARCLSCGALLTDALARVAITMQGIGPPATPRRALPDGGNSSIQWERLVDHRCPIPQVGGWVGRRNCAHLTTQSAEDGQPACLVSGPVPGLGRAAPQPAGNTLPLGGTCPTTRLWQSFSPSSWAACCRARAPFPCVSPRVTTELT